MKKIMFNDKYGLTDAVLAGRKTMTRRIVTPKQEKWLRFIDGEPSEWIRHGARFLHGEEIAIAQSYESLNKMGFVAPEWCEHSCEDSAGYNNKMFVRADLMPHRIRIKKIKVERLQDISDEDCMSEGIYRHNAAPDALGEDRYKFISYSYDATPGKNHKRWWFHTHKEAFAALIDKVSGKGTWEKNPFVFAYEFELVR